MTSASCDVHFDDYGVFGYQLEPEYTEEELRQMEEAASAQRRKIENNLKRKILCETYISYIFHVFSEARDHILILNILFFNKLRQIIPEVRSEMRDLLIFIFILKTTGTFTPVHSAGYLILRNEFRSTQEIARQNIQVSFYIRSTGSDRIPEYMCHNIWQ